MQDLLPVKSKQTKIKTRYFTYFIFVKGKKLAMKKRMAKDIWSGLYDFYLVEGKRLLRPEKIIENEKDLGGIQPNVNIEFMSEPYRHILTHQHIKARFVILSLSQGILAKDVSASLGVRFYSLSKVASLPKPALVSRFLSKNGILE